MEIQDALKCFTTKLIDCIFSLHNSPLRKKDSTDNIFQIKPTSHPYVHSELNHIWQTFNQTHKNFSVEIFQQTENCSPLLLERWIFDLTPLHIPCQFLDTNKFSQTLRSLLCISALLPSSLIPTKSLLIKHNGNLSIWPSSLASSDIISYPKTPFRLDFNSTTLYICVQYYTKYVKPSISIQTLGERPRLLSVGSMDIPNFNNQRRSSLEIRSKNIFTVTDQALYEDDEIGFKLINSEFIGDSLEIEEFGNSSFDMEIGIQSDSNTPEEAKISIYMLSCDKIRELEMFKHGKNIDAKSLIEQWRS